MRSDRGCMMPNSSIDAASSSSASWSNTVRGCSGFGSISFTGISLMADEPSVCISVIGPAVIMASRPRPKALFFGVIAWSVF